MLNSVDLPAKIPLHIGSPKYVAACKDKEKSLEKDQNDDMKKNKCSKKTIMEHDKYKIGDKKC